jgi:tRNA nucleotidyltransferase (CCA-adding enzyme)
MVELWYAMYPELEVKSIYLLVGEKRYKLSSANIAHKVRNITATDPAAWAAYKALEPLGNVYAVGGAIRDVVLGVTPKDVDLMVQGVEPEDVQSALEALPGRVDYTGQQFGVFRYRDPDGNEVEVALPRTERSTGSGHKDFEVFTSPFISVGEDLARRDFTGNAMAVNLATGDLIDPYRGSEDLKSGVLKTVSDRSFPEDPLRILRALSSVSRHGLDPSPELYHQMSAHAADLTELPQERVMMELDKMMGGKDPAKAIAFAEATGVLKHILPEVHATIGFDQKNKYHALQLNDHLRKVLNRAADRTEDLDVRWAALLHDIGKPASQWMDDEGWGHYYKNEKGEGEDHEDVGAHMAKAAMERLKFPNDRIERTQHLIQHHMFPKFDNEKGARKFLNRVGDEHAEPLLTLRDADAGGKGSEWDGHVNVMRQLVQTVQEQQQPTQLSQLAINGRDLIEAGIQPGPQMGEILRFLTDAVVEDPTLNERSTLLEMALGSDPGIVKEANILDPISDTLDEEVFNNAASLTPHVKPKIVEWVIDKVHSTLVKAGWPDPREMDYLKLILTGSLTTYQWSETSDFDVSLWVETENLPEWVRADLIAMMVEACDGVVVPGTTHPLQVFVVDSRTKTPNDLYKPGLRSAYDLEKKEWFVLPEKQRVQDVYKNYPATIAYARGCVDKIRMLLRYDKYALETYWDFLHHLRARSMQNGEGDYSEANIVYKMVVNEGLLPHIGEATGRYYAA